MTTMNASLNTWQMRFAVISAFLVGFSIPVSTALENISVGLLFLAFLTVPRLWPEVLRALRQPFVLMCLMLYGVLLFGVTYSSAEWKDAVQMLSRMREYLLVPLFFVLCLHVPVRRAVLIGFAAGALLSVLVSVTSALAGADALIVFNAFFGHPVLHAVPQENDWTSFRTHIAHNLFASLLVLGLLVMQLTGVLRAKWRPWAWVVMAVCVIDILFLVKGRTTQFSLLFLIGLILFIWNRRVGLVLALCGLLLVPPVAYMSSSAIRDGIAKIENNLNQYQQGNVDTSVGLRLDFYKNSLALIQEKPLLGHGTGSFTEEYRRLTGYKSGNMATSNPHNDYLWMGVEQGIIGILALLGVIGGVLIHARRRARTEHWMAIALVSTMAIGSLANSFFTDNASRVCFIMLACALLAGETFSFRDTDQPQ